MSQVKNRLFIGNIPKDLKLDDIQAVLDKEVRGRRNTEMEIGALVSMCQFKLPEWKDILYISLFKIRLK